MTDNNHKHNKTLIVIPTYNEAKTIVMVIENVLAYCKDILVVDDGSNDNTLDLIIDANVKTITHNKNRGYNRTLHTGIEYAKNSNYKYAITMDADDQHDPKLIKQFINHLEKNADLVVGIRDQQQRFSEKIFSFVSRFIWKIQDPLCGFKGYNLDFLRKNNLVFTYDSVGTQLAIKTSVLKGKIIQIPFKAAARIDTPRFGSGLRPNLKILLALINGIILK